MFAYSCLVCAEIPFGQHVANYVQGSTALSLLLRAFPFGVLTRGGVRDDTW